MTSNLSADLESLLRLIADWKKEYIKKCEEVSNLELALTTLKEDLRFTKESDATSRCQISRCQQTISRLQALVQDISKIKEEKIELIKDKKNLEVELNNLKKEQEVIKLAVARDKSELIKKYDLDFNWIKQLKDHEMETMREDLEKRNEEVKNRFDELENKYRFLEQDSQHTLNRVINDYEVKLSKMNEDLALAQTEIKNLRQRCASNISNNLYQNKKIEKGQYGDFAPASTMHPLILPPSSVHSVPKEPLTSSSRPPSPLKTGQKVPFPSIRKRKLFSRSDDFL